MTADHTPPPTDPAAQVAPTNPAVAEIISKLDLVSQRLAQYAVSPVPNGLTQPDAGGTEQWNAAQVWAHMAEFVPYWQDQLAKVISAYTGTPVPFGRTKEDPTRIGAIQAGQDAPVPMAAQQVQDAIAQMRSYLSTITPEQWQAIGLHSTRGQMTVPQMVQRFTLDHLQEHADQLATMV